MFDHLAARVVNTCRSSEGSALWRTLEALADIEVEDSGDQKAVVVAVGESETQTLGAVVQTSGVEDSEVHEGRAAYPAAATVPVDSAAALAG